MTYSEWTNEVRKNRETWCEALESGEYKQGQECLCKKDSECEFVYCCLGVMMEINHINKEFNGCVANYNRLYDLFPPDNLMWKKYGLTHSQASDLADRNDGSMGYSQHSFAKIAAVIRQLPIPTEEEYNETFSEGK